MTKEHKLGEQEQPALGWRATGWNITDAVILSTIQGYFWLISSNGEELLLYCGTISPLIKHDPTRSNTLDGLPAAVKYAD